MTPTDPPDLEPSLTALLRAEREDVGMPPEAQAALWARIETSIAAPPPGMAPPRGSTGASSFASANALRIVVAALGVTAGAAAIGFTSRHSEPRPAAEIDHRPSPSSTSAFEPSAARQPVEEPAREPTRDESPPPLATPAPMHRSVPRPQPPSDDDLAKERALIEAARRAIRSGAPGEGFDKLDEHARSFPHGRLGEERDALRVLALRASGREAEATLASGAFRKRYPHSLLLGTP